MHPARTSPAPCRFSPGPFWLTRLYLTFDIATELLIALTRPLTANGTALRLSGPFAVYWAGLLLALAGLLLADVLVNDVLPPQRRLRCMLRWRVWVLVASAFGQMGMCAAVLTYDPGGWDYFLRFFGPAVALMALAFFDTFRRGVRHE